MSFCAVCLDPASALPSARLVRGALIALAVCVVLGLVFLIATPRLPGEDAHAAATPAASGTADLAASLPPVIPPPTTIPSATPATGPDYTVRAGDTLQSIATANGVTAAAIQQLNLGIDPAGLQIGQVIHMPPKAP